MTIVEPQLESADWPATEAILECYVATGAWSAARAVFAELERLRSAGRLELTRDEEVAWRLLEIEVALQAEVGCEECALAGPGREVDSGGGDSGGGDSGGGDSGVGDSGGGDSGGGDPDRPDGCGAISRGADPADGVAVLIDTLKVCGRRESLDAQQLAAAALLETLVHTRDRRPAAARRRAQDFLQSRAADGVEPGWRARLMLTASRAAHELGRHAEAGSLARGALGAARRAERADLAGEALLALGRMLLATGRAPGAAPFLLSARSALLRAGRLHQALVTLLALAQARWCEGRVGDSLGLHEQALGEARALGQSLTEIATRIRLARILGRMSRPGDARAHVITALRQARRLGEARCLLDAYATLAQVCATAGAREKSRRALRLASRVLQGADLADGARAVFHARAAEALALLEADSEAEQHADEALRCLNPGRQAGLEVAAHRARGLALLRRGRSAEAVSALSGALRLAACAGIVPERAEIAWILAHALAAQARTPESRAAAARQCRAAQSHLARLRLRPPALEPGPVAAAESPGATAPPPGPSGRPADPIATPRPARDAGDPDPGPQRWEAFGIITRSQVFHSELLHVARIAASTLPILIQGETGAGKELVARAAHRMSGRRGGFVVFNAATRRGELLEAELFGHRRGAFTGAHRDREGLILQAEGGTLFLDEIADLDPPAQAALLRFLDSGEVRPVGSDRVQCVSARVIAASHRSLSQLVAQGGYRGDLYFRLAGAEIHVPPLRSRREDIPPLVRAFAARHGLAPGRLGPILAAGLGARLQSYAWPGNVRQLQHCVAQVAALAASAVPHPQIERLIARALRATLPAGGAPARRARADSERARPTRDELAGLVRKHGGNIAGIARELNTYRTRVYRLLHYHGLELADGRNGRGCPAE